MCGIAGIWAPGSAMDASAHLDSMLDSIRHRGPDGRGSWRFADGAIGMVRLALLDLTERGQQPLYANENRVGIVFNGEVYNFREERQLLEARGYRFVTSTDTEVVLASYLEHGLRFVERLRGMFALAIVDLRGPERLVLARDPLGIKPLYIAERGKGVAFASEARALVRAGLVGWEPRPKVAPRLLELGFRSRPEHRAQRGTPDGRGHPRSLRSKTAQYTSLLLLPRFTPRARPIEDAAAELRETLKRTVQSHAFADAEVGAFLSGGVDSTAIAALMRPHVSGALKTFTLRFPDVPGAGKPSWRVLGAAPRLRASDRRCDRQDIGRSFDDFVSDIDQPSTDGLNTWLVSRAASRSVKGVLSGLGADELFGGYPTARRIAALRSIRGRAIQTAANALSLLGPHLTDERLLGVAARRDGLSIWRHAHRALPASTLARLDIRPPTAATWLQGILDREDSGWRRTPLVEQAGLLDLTLYMRDQLLRDSDVMSMAHSLELRVPFVDVEMVAFARTVPPTQKINARRESASEYGSSGAKRVLIEAVKDVLPPDIFQRPKRGFSLPFDRWLSGPLAAQQAQLDDPRAPIWEHVDRRAFGRTPRTLPAFPGRFALVLLNAWLATR
ncbi:MAG: asparagine synthase (glutamine-hydrolyzing) [Polyangiales bacterium]